MRFVPVKGKAVSTTNGLKIGLLAASWLTALTISYDELVERGTTQIQLSKPVVALHGETGA